jgi:hypothetical protein
MQKVPELAGVKNKRNETPLAFACKYIRYVDMATAMELITLCPRSAVDIRDHCNVTPLQYCKYSIIVID